MPGERIQYMRYLVEIPTDYESWTVPQRKAWSKAKEALEELWTAMSHVGPPEETGKYREGYEAGLEQGYHDGVRDAQIELRNSIKDLQGAREMVIRGYDTEDEGDDEHTT